MDRNLPPCPGAGRHPECVQRQSQQTGADLFAAGNNRIIFPHGQIGIVRAGLFHQSHQTVRIARHGRNQYSHFIARFPFGPDQTGHMARRMEEIALEDSYFKDRNLYPNVDFYSGIIMRAMGIPVNMFTVLFAIG